MTWFTLSVEGWMREWMVAGPRDHKAEGCPVQTPSTGRKFAVCVVSGGSRRHTTICIGTRATICCRVELSPRP